jgi:hypothetical protein
MDIGHWANARPTGEPRCRVWSSCSRLWWTVPALARAGPGQTGTAARLHYSFRGPIADKGRRPSKRLSPHLNSDDGELYESMFSAPRFPTTTTLHHPRSDPRPVSRRPPIASPPSRRSTTATPTRKQAFHSRRWRLGFAHAETHADTRDETPAACDVPRTHLHTHPIPTLRRSTACLPGIHPISA